MIVNDILIAKEARKQARLERLGSNVPRCGTCGESDDRCLELHHVAGRKSDPTVVHLCRNCHRKVTDDQKDVPPYQPNSDAFLDAVGRFLLGLAHILALIIERLIAFGNELIRRAAPTVEEVK